MAGFCFRAQCGQFHAWPTPSFLELHLYCPQTPAIFVVDSFKNLENFTLFGGVGENTSCNCQTTDRNYGNPSICGMGHDAAYLVRVVQLQGTQPL